ncbi:hypothetical protein RJ640_011879 [Escallonia rubra]|uniref:GBF-interacting protein 1 N-terminal domain-containing protein n=1 Tax=Escallonia rubra TaxID=112253 RepID=A0AA88RVE3_9ASTE|nr:hypothetical protein RJ640_011879 [Escallonia rubra]
MSSGDGVSSPGSVRQVIQTIKEITDKHSEEEIYAMLKECSMDPNETIQKLLLQDTFHEVKRKRGRRKENLNKEPAESRWKPGMQGRGNRGGRGNYPPRYTSQADTAAVSLRLAAQLLHRSSFSPADLHQFFCWFVTAFKSAKINKPLNARLTNHTLLTCTSAMFCSSSPQALQVRKERTIIVYRNEIFLDFMVHNIYDISSTSATDGPAGVPSESIGVVHAGHSLARDRGNQFEANAVANISKFEAPPPLAPPADANKKSSIAFGTGDIDDQLLPSSSNISASTTSAPSPGVCFSASDPVLVPSHDSRLPNAVGAIRREVGSQRPPVEEIPVTPSESKLIAGQNSAQFAKLNV